MRQNSNPSFYLIDTTLRDGEQTPGVAFSSTQKCEIARALTQLGIREIEAGTPVCSEQERQALIDIVALNLPSRVTGWCRAVQADVVHALQCGLEAVHISLPVSSIHLAALSKSESWVLDQAMAVVRWARARVSFLSVGFQDASRADLSFLEQLIYEVQRAQVDRVRLADTVGILEPIRTYRWIEQLRAYAPNIELGFHAHNDLGMATANTLAALQAGVDSVDVTVNGLGERAGNASLDEVLMASHVALGQTLDMDVTELMAVSSLVARASGRPVPVNKPVTGQAVFTHESGIHIHAMLKDTRSYEPFPPAQVGRTGSRFVLGKHSGQAAQTFVASQPSN